MSDGWNDPESRSPPDPRRPDPEPRRADLSRRQLLATAGAVAGVAGGAVLLLPDTVEGAGIATLTGERTGSTTVQLEAGVGLVVTASVSNAELAEPEIGVEVRHTDRDEVVVDRTAADEFTARGRTETGGTYRVDVAAQGTFEVELSRRVEVF